MIKLHGRSGHNISSNAVRAEYIPDAVNKRAVFAKLFEADQKTIKSEYNKIIEYLDKVKMTVIENTNNMSWKIVVDTIQLDSFISPADVITPNYKFSYGYTAEIYFKNNYGKFEQLSPLKYAFDYYSGVLTFNNDLPADELFGYTELYFTGFRYTGKFVDIYLTELQKSLQEADSILKAELSEIIEHNKAEAEKNLQEFKDAVEKEKNELVGKLKEAIDAANTELERAQTALYTKIEQTKTKLNGDIKAVEEGYEKADNILKASALAIKKIIFSTATSSDQIKIAPVENKVELPDDIVIYVNGDEQRLCTRKIQCTIKHYCFSVDSAIDKDGNGKIDVTATSKSSVKDIFENLSTDIRQTYIANDSDSTSYWESVIEIHAPCTGDGEFIIDIDAQGNVTTGTLWFVCNVFLRNDNKPIQMLDPEYLGDN